MKMAARVNRQPTLPGPTLVLRPLAQSDSEPLYVYASDPLAWEQHPERERWLRPTFDAYFASLLASGGALAAVRTKDDHLIGTSRLSVNQEGDLEIGWTFLGKPHWGGSCNREMKTLMLAHAFQLVDSVVFSVGSSNWRSRRAVEKLGAVLETEFMSAMGPAVRYRLGRDVWQTQ